VTRLILELEEGYAVGAQRKLAYVPLYHRNPLLVWQMIAAALALALAITLARG
jgi:hypothetical protein